MVRTQEQDDKDMDQPEGQQILPLNPDVDDEEPNTLDDKPPLVRRLYTGVDDGTEEAMSDCVERVWQEWCDTMCCSGKFTRTHIHHWQMRWLRTKFVSVVQRCLGLSIRGQHQWG